MIDDVKKFLGLRTDAQLARLVRVSRQSVREWRKSGEIPPGRVLQLNRNNKVPMKLMTGVKK